MARVCQITGKKVMSGVPVIILRHSILDVRDKKNQCFLKKVVEKKVKPQPLTRTVTYTKEDGRKISEGKYNLCDVHGMRRSLKEQRDAANVLAACLREYNKFAKKEGWELV